MKRWTQSQVLELLRRVLFGTFLLCSVGIGLLVSNPSWVDQLDQSLVASYSNRYKERFAEANKLILENDPASDQLAIARIEALLDDLESVGKTDRLGSIKNRCFSVGIKALVRTNRLELAREWVARWMRFDDKNLNTVVLAATIETGLGEAQAAFSHLEDLYSLVPEWNVASSAYSRMLIRQERYVDAAKVILESPTLVAAPRWSEPWTVYWAEGRGFSSGDRTTVKPVLDSHGKIQFSINATNLKTHLRIDLPAFLAGTLVRPELKIQDQQGSSTIIKLWEPKVHFHQVHRRESRIDSPGEPSPHFWLALPTEFQNKAITVKFQAETEPLGPSSDLLLSLPNHDEVERLLGERLGPAWASRFRRARLISLEHSKMSLFWRLEDQAFQAERRRDTTIQLEKDGDTLRLHAVFDQTLSAQWIRLDFPDSLSFKILPEALTIQSSLSGDSSESSPGDYRLSPLKPSRLHDMSIDFQGYLTVTGADPYFSIELPEDSRQEIIRVGFVGRLLP